MLVVDFKLAFFLFLLLLGGLLWATWAISRRRVLFDDQQYAVWYSFPLGMILLSSTDHLQFANRNAYRLLQVERDMVTTAVYAHLLQKIKQNQAIQQFSLSPSPELTLDVWVGCFRTHSLVMLRDVSEQRQREMEMYLYWSSVSHELRTPLTSILSHLEIFRLENVPENVQKHSLEIIHQQTHRLNHLINSTLDLGRLKAVANLPKLKVDIILVAEEVIAALILLAEAEGIGLNFCVNSPVPPVLGNPDKLKQLFTNLLDNAIKYCRSGDTVTVSLTAVTHTVQCQIADTGPGILAEHLPRLTQQFYRARRDVPGSGLGLAIVDEIVRQHDGNLFIESTAEGSQTGTTVTFTLPILSESVQQPQ